VAGGTCGFPVNLARSCLIADGKLLFEGKTDGVTLWDVRRRYQGRPGLARPLGVEGEMMKDGREEIDRALRFPSCGVSR
jgi:hypothetical protein